MPLQDVHLSHCSAGLWRYIFLSLFLFLFARATANCLEVGGDKHPPLQSECSVLVQEHTPSRVHKCVPDRGACCCCCCYCRHRACARLIKRLFVMQWQQNPPPCLSRALTPGWGGRPGSTGLFFPLAPSSARRTRVPLLLGPWWPKSCTGDTDNTIRCSGKPALGYSPSPFCPSLIWRDSR